MQYRPEIDGLRTLAIIPVVFFHAGYTFVSGGYLGVDVFFVISGYLITAIILSELEKGTFSIANFYRKRARRILPALFVVMFACTPIAWLYLTPTELQQFSQSILAVIFFVSNVFFAYNSGYFDGEAETKPLLHTWSLSVEEQYYVLIPLLLLYFWRKNPKFVVLALLVIGVSSICWAQWKSTGDPISNFFLLPSRAWELMIGGLIAKYELKTGPNRSAWLSQWLPLLGLSLILYAMVSFNTTTHHPGFITLIPVLGAGLIIRFGNVANPTTWLLSSPLFIGVGLISYSLYLWHQPIFAFTRLILGEPGMETYRLLCIVLAVLLSIASWRWIENPFRKKTVVFGQPALQYACLCALTFVVFGAVGHETKGFVNLRFDDRILAIHNTYRRYPIKNELYRTGLCFLENHQTNHDFADQCFAPDINGRNTDVLWGDSHSASLYYGFKQSSHRRGKVQLNASGCPPLLNFTSLHPHCVAINHSVMNMLRTKSGARVLLVSDWRTHSRKKDFDPALDLTLQQLLEWGLEPVLIGSLPQWEKTLPEKVIQAITRHSKDFPQVIASDLYTQLQATDAHLKRKADKLNVAFISLLKQSCTPQGCAAVTPQANNRALLAWDNAHLTKEGSAYYAKLIFNQLDKRDPNRYPEVKIGLLSRQSCTRMISTKSQVRDLTCN